MNECVAHSLHNNYKITTTTGIAPNVKVLVVCYSFASLDIQQQVDGKVDVIKERTNYNKVDRFTRYLH